MKSNLLLAFLLITNISHAQSIKGKIIDNNNEPIEYASVVLYQQADSALIDGVISDQHGFFALKNVGPGNYYVEAQFMGYNTRQIESVAVLRNKDVDLTTIVLSPNQKMLEDVEITGERATSRHKIDRNVYEAKRFKSAKGGSAIDILRNLPGVSLNGQGQVSVRGTTGFVMLLNGKPVQTDAATIMSQLPANAIENVEIITAPSAVYDPEGKAGIINIITSKGASDGTFLQVNAKVGMPHIENYDNPKNAQRYGTDFTVNYRKKKWDISVGGSYLRNDLAGRREGDVYTIIDDTLTSFASDGERSFDEVSYSGRFTLGFTPNEANDFSLGFYAGKRSKDRLADIIYYDNHASYPTFSNERLYTFQYYNHNLRIRRSDVVLGSFDYAHTFASEAELSTSVLYEYTMLGGPTVNQNVGWPDTDIMYQDEYNTNDNPLHGIRIQADYKSKPLRIGTFETGYQYRHLDHVGDFLYERRTSTTEAFAMVPEFSSKVNLKRAIHSVYGQLTGKTGKISYGVGLRMESMDRELALNDKAGEVDSTYRYDFIKPFPSANIQYAINDELTLKAAYSKRIARTTTFKMNPFAEREHSETLEQGDATLLPEFIDVAELGLVKYFGENSVFVTSYFRNIENVINRVNTVENDTILNRIYSNVGSSRAFGFELGTELNLSDKFKIFAGGNIYNYDLEGSFDNDPIKTSTWIYSINANTTFDVSKIFSVQWSLNYISDRITAQGRDSRYLSPNLSIQKRFMGEKLTATLQWMNMDMGLLPSNEQRITTWKPGQFYTTTNYVYEVDVLMLNLSYAINKLGNKAKFSKSEFGEKEF